MNTCSPLPRVCVQARGINLSCVRTCVVVAEERPRVSLTHSFSKLFKDIGLSSRAVSTTFGSRVNVAICLQVRLPRALCWHWHQIPDCRLGFFPHSPSAHASGSQHLPCREQLAQDLSGFSHFQLPNRITDAQNKWNMNLSCLFLHKQCLVAPGWWMRGLGVSPPLPKVPSPHSSSRKSPAH